MIKLAGIFKDNMVLQRDRKICVFGTTDCETITILIKDASEQIIQEQTVNNQENGPFKIYMEPLKAGGPYSINVNEILLSNVYSGEVWLAGGQSNMELELQNSLDGKSVVEQAGSDEIDNNIRFYYTPKVVDISDELYVAEDNSCWQEASKDTVSCWSAVGYYYARYLAKKLGCKIGIIGCNWGGTSASCWMSREKLLSTDATRGYIDRYDVAIANQDYDEYLKEYEDYLVFQADFDKKVGEYYATNPNPTWDEANALYGPNRYPGPMGPKNFTRPAGLYETMLSRVAPYGIKGFIFYQGEEDDNRPYNYRNLLKLMIENWREVFEDEDLPFINVQLPIYQDEGEREDNNGPWRNWPFIREAQYLLTKEVNNYYVITALDKGEYHNIHPLDKETIGKRLAYSSLVNVYGTEPDENLAAPTYKKKLIEGNRMLLCFDNAEGGLVLADSKYSKPTVISMDSGEVLEEGNDGEALEIQFEVAGEDKVFYEATEVIVGDLDMDDDIYQVMVYSCNVRNPRYVRYFWKNYGEVRLFGKNGVPVMPFRSSSDDGAVANWSRQGEILN